MFVQIIKKIGCFISELVLHRTFFPDGVFLSPLLHSTNNEPANNDSFREGDHAEYTLLDKKNRHRELTGCWLFATLEPCAPGARNTPKVSCAERIVNARISKVWFGIEDKNPKVDHGGIDHLLENHVEVHQFSPEFHEDIEKVNENFMKWANFKNEEEKTKKLKPKNPLLEVAAETNSENLSDVALQKFINESKRKYEPNSNEFLEELKEMGLLEYDEKTTKYLPTGNAILLFGKNPRHKFPNAAIKAKVNYGNGETGAETFDKALVLIPDEVEDWLKKVLPASIDRSKFKAQQIPSFPIKVIREAIINAIAHRDYSLDGAKVQLEVHPDRIIVKSPGTPVPPITLESLKNYSANSYSRNKMITFILNEMEYMEESALGMDTFRSMREKHKLPLPIFEYDGINVVITFPRNTDAIKDISEDKQISKLRESQLLGYEWLKIKRETSTREYSSHFNIGYKTAQRHLAKMKELGLIKDNGEDVNSPNYKYVIA